MPPQAPFLPEIIHQIIHYLTHGWIGPQGPDESLALSDTVRWWGRIGGSARYATVDRTWQEMVERETFAELHLDLGRLREAGAILNGVPRRQQYVRTIRLNVVLPSEEPPLRVFEPLREETAEDKDQNDRLLRDTLVAFLSTLSCWTPGPPVKLHLDAFALTDYGHRDAGKIRPLSLRLPRHDSLLELKDAEGVLCCGPVNVITEVDMERNRLSGRRISCAAVCTLLARLPATKKVSINWCDIEGDPKAQSDFTEALSKITHTVDRFHIDGTDSQPAQQPQDSEAKVDEPSLALGIFSQRVRNLELYHFAASDDLFLQQNLPPEISSPHWALMEDFGLYYPPVSPSGQSLFYPDPHAADRDPAPSIAAPSLQRRYLAAARSALEMPLLRDMRLVAQLDLKGDRHWHSFWYHRDPGNKAAAKALWTSSSGFVPEDEVLEAWREVARKHSDKGGLEVEILDDEYAV